MQFLVLNGPNLNLLGQRETAVYGAETLQGIIADTDRVAAEKGVHLRWFQSNIEGELVNCIQAAAKDCNGIIINPAGYGHTSVALRDALLAVSLPTVEIHLTNLLKREEFRHRTLTGDVAVGQINGFGAYGYQLAVNALYQHLVG
jgi:3-dehydroquinate dehydratase-2